jgi:hypothetical protein
MNMKPLPHYEWCDDCNNVLKPVGTPCLMCEPGKQDNTRADVYIGNGSAKRRAATSAAFTLCCIAITLVVVAAL